MTNQEPTKLLRKIAAAYILKNSNRFKIVAYERAADTIEQAAIDVEQLWREKRLSEIEGVGATLSESENNILKK